MVFWVPNNINFITLIQPVVYPSERPRDSISQRAAKWRGNDNRVKWKSQSLKLEEFIFIHFSFDWVELPHSHLDLTFLFVFHSPLKPSYTIVFTIVTKELDLDFNPKRYVVADHPAVQTHKHKHSNEGKKWKSFCECHVSVIKPWQITY